ncbi:centrosomal protein of 57 kDa-like isoform X2 [Lineus longissimus]|uniref:centrosomal protein of 57 kDa-like isoform X2 n=1 Tax=Lineus longissimus TaxID=88925 RepID=UPI00315CA773
MLSLKTNRLFDSFGMSGGATAQTSTTSPRFGRLDPSLTKDMEEDSLSSRYVYPRTTPFINSDYRKHDDSPLSSFPEHNRRAVMTALKNLQEKIRRLEVDRSAAEGNLRSLTTETSKFRDMWSQELNKKETKQSEISKETQELESQLNSYESRCSLLEKQLEYMRKLVTNAEKDKQEIMQRQYTKNREHSAATETEIKDHMDKISELEREQLKLTATQTVAQNKIRELEDKLRKEKQHRKVMQEKTAEIETAAAANRILLSSDGGRKPTTKKKKTAERAKSARSTRGPHDHYHLNLAEIPFLQSKSTSPSHHVGANVQKVLQMLKSHNTQMCGGPPQPTRKTVKTCRSSISSQDSEESDLTDLLLQLHDEFASMSFEHQELTKQIHEAGEDNLRDDLERELEALVGRMEAKGEQIGRLKRHQQGLQDKKKKRKPKAKKVRAKTAVRHYCPNNENGGEVQVTTTIKTKGQSVQQLRMSSRDSNLKMLKDMKKLQTTLRMDDLSWDC